MTNLEEMERRYIEAARKAWSPSTHDAERVFLALNDKMASSSSTAESSQPAAPRADTVPSPVGEGVRGLSGSAFLSSVPRWMLAAVALAGTAGSGYALGFRAGSRAAVPVATQVAESAPVPARSARQLESAFREHTAAPPTSEPLPRTSQPGIANRDEPAAPSTSGSTRGKRASASLDEEVRMLRRVERALREQNPRFALALLEDLDRAVPNGQLREERFAASTLARCALGYGSPSALLEEFSKGHASSAYLTRIKQACASEPAQRDGSD